MQRAIKVSQVNFYVRSLLDGDERLNGIYVTGEISNLKDHYGSGHIYLSLKDEKAVISAVIFKNNVRNLKFKLADHIKVIARGRITLYEPTGQYQFYIEDMQPEGIGALALSYEQLKSKLLKKGYFEQDHKKGIPKYPEHIGVVTSISGAAVEDIKNILRRRSSNVNIVLCNVPVQGESAPEYLAEAVMSLDRHKAVDVIIIGRGGGSAEDLWAFNSEILADAIYSCGIPVISAVGHETDYTICDFVSDLRAPTPSAAAELAVQNSEEIKLFLDGEMQYLQSLIQSKLLQCETRLRRLQSRIEEKSPGSRINNSFTHLTLLEQRIKFLINRKYQESKTRLSQCAALLEGLNPISVLSRGYAVAMRENHVISSVNELKPNDAFTLKLKDGTLEAIVL